MKRKIVVVDCEKITPLIKRNEWNNSSFSRKVGKYSSWYGEVLRGNNLPSPEEAARMCVLLQTTPEEILTNPADIELVNSLIEAERGKAPEKETPAGVGGGKDALLDFIRKTDDRTTLLAVLDEVNKKLQEMR